MLQRHYFEEAVAQNVAKGVLTVAFPMNSESFELANTRDVVAAVQARLAEVGARDVAVKFVQSESVRSTQPVPTAQPAASTARPADAPANRAPASAKPAPSAGAPPKPAPITLSKEEFLNDPLIKQALETFKATLVEVRAPGPDAAV